MSQSLRVLHVVATGQRRGAETFASDLVGALGNGSLTQDVAILHGDDDISIEFPRPPNLIAAAGPMVPGIKVQAGRLRELRRLVRAVRPDVIQAHGGEPLKYSVMARGTSRTPIVYRRIGAAGGWISKGRRATVHGSLMRKASRVIAVSTAIRSETIDTFALDPERVLTIPNAVDVRRVRPDGVDGAAFRRSIGITPDRTIVLYLGALSWEKDPLAFVGMATRLGNLDRRPAFVLVGDGPLRAEVDAAVAAEGLSDTVYVLGNRSDVADALSAADALVLTSKTEGMPACIIEAGLAGLPVVSYDLGGIPEVVTDGVTGLVVSAGDGDRLTAAVAHVLSDHAARARMGDAAARWCRGRFEISIVAPQYRAVYDLLAARPMTTEIDTAQGVRKILTGTDNALL